MDLANYLTEPVLIAFGVGFAAGFLFLAAILLLTMVSDALAFGELIRSQAKAIDELSKQLIFTRAQFEARRESRTEDLTNDSTRYRN